MEKVELSAANTEQRAQLPQKGSPSSSPTSAGFHQPTGANSTNSPSLSGSKVGKVFPQCCCHSGILRCCSRFSLSSIRVLVPGCSRAKQEKVPGRDPLPGEVRGFMEQEDGGKQRMRRLWEAREGNLKEGVGCQGGFWTNPEHRGLMCRHGNVWQMTGGDKTSREHDEEAEEKGGTLEEWH